MSRDLRDQLVARVPVSPDKLILLYPDREMPGKLNLLFYGLSYEQIAEALYQMADQIVDQKIPPPDWRTRIKRE